METSFTGFPQEGLSFLDHLGEQDKRWFDQNRKVYDDSVVTPTKAFVSEMGEQLANSFAPGISAVPRANGSIAPINNDLRFSPDKAPYKDHLLLKFWEGPNKKVAPTLYVRISASDVGFATGAMLPDLERWRELVAADSTGGSLATHLAQLGEGRPLDIAGEGYKRVPKPYPEDHPRAALLRHKMMQARWSEPLPDLVTKPGFVDFCVERLEACAPIHLWLVEHLSVSPS